MLPFNIEAAVLCDFVRIENTGKHILIGVYLGSIVLSSVPANMILTLWLEAKPEKPCKISGEMRVVSQDGSTLVQGKYNLNVETLDNPAILNLENIPFQVQKYVPIEFQIRQDGGEWVTIKKIEIRPVAQNVTASAIS